MTGVYVDAVDNFLSIARADPDRIAFIEEGEDGFTKKITFNELDITSSRLAGYLREQGLSVGDVIILAMPNSIAYIQAALAALRSGIRMILLNEHAAVANFEFALDRFAVTGAVVDPGFSQALTSKLSGQGRMLRISGGTPVPGWNALEDILSAPREPFVEPAFAESDTAVVLFTSGSTGVPKAIVKARSNFGRNALIGSDARLLITAPLYYLPGVTSVFAYLLRSGGTGVLSRTKTPRHLLTLLSKHGCTATSLVPALATMWLSELARDEKLAFPALKTLWVGGAPLRAEVLKQLKAAFPGADIIYAYGLTEAPSVISPQGRSDAPDGSIGRLDDNVEGKLVTENGATGDLGELWLRGPAVARTMAPGPASAETGAGDDWLRTGDVLRRDADGWYYFLGRIDDMYVRGGEKFYPAQVETVLAGHPNVQDVCVVAFDDRILGQIPGALIVPVADATVSMADIADFCTESNQRMYCPQVMVVVEQLPLLPSGKIDRGEAARILQSNLASASTNLVDDEAEALEAVIAREWRQATKRELSDWDADFFETAIDSLSIALFLALLGSACGGAVSFGDVLDYPSARALANHLRLQAKAQD